MFFLKLDMANQNNVVKEQNNSKPSEGSNQRPPQVPTQPVVQQTPAQNSQPVNQRQEVPKKKSKKGIWWILGILGLIIISGVVYYLFFM